MPKIKTRKSIFKRFKVTGSSKVLRGHLGGRHRKSHKSTKSKRYFSEPIALNTKQANAVKALIGRY